MTVKALSLALLIPASIALGWQLRTWYPATNPTQSFASAAETADLEPLRARLEQLDIDLTAARARNSELETALATQLQSSSAALDEDPAIATENQRGHPGSTISSSIPELETLTAAQIPLATAEAIRAQIGQNRLAMLKLRDQAEREGWLNSSRYVQELRQLLDPTQGIRDRFGDDIYDRYLYASEKPNRVLASAVYPNSTAAVSGFQPGDIVLSYAGKNIYSMNDLQQATREGEAGESVLVILQRDATSFSLTLPRGPLGIELKMQSQAPE